MDEQEKPFDTVSIVLLLTIAGFSDGADLATALLFPVPIIGQVTYLGNSFLISPITYAIIQGWFIMKTSGGRMSLGSFTSFIPVLGGLGNLVNIPGSEFITTAIALWMADHPKAAALAVVAGAAAATGGAGAATAGGATGGAAGGVAATGVATEVAAGAETTAAGVATETKTGVGAVEAETRRAGEIEGKTGRGESVSGEAEGGGGTRETGAMSEGRGTGERAAEPSEAESPEKEISPEALGGKKEIMEQLKEDLTQGIPDSSQRKNQNEDDDVTIDGNTVHL